uniref:Uncharacterized protein n=1 Tax=Brassica oleracea TaxID=3712 RepID=A0A3P6AXU5_BRAOL|nr:unnamed protein product [Brassica oleracea]
MEMKGKYLVTIILLVSTLSVGMCSNRWIRAHATFYGVNDSPASLGKKSILLMLSFVLYYKLFFFLSNLYVDEYVHRRSLWV